MPTLDQHAAQAGNIATYFIGRVKQEYQSGMLLRGKTTEETNFVGGKASFPVFGQSESHLRQPGRDVIINDDIQSAVVANVEDYTAAELIHSEINKKVAYKTIEAYSMRAVKAIGRRADHITLQAINSVRNGNTVAATLRDEGDSGSGATGLNQAKVLRAKAIMDANAVDMENRYFAITAAALSDILSQERFTSSDFATSIMPLRDGKVAMYAGFEFIVIPERTTGGLPFVGTPGGTTATRTMFAWHKEAVGCAISDDIHAEVNYLPEKTSYLVNAMYQAGATVIDRKGVVHIGSTEAYIEPISSVE